MMAIVFLSAIPSIDRCEISTMLLPQCARAGMWNRGAVLLEKMKKSNTAKPDTRSYTCLIDACAKAEDGTRAIAYLNEMLDSGVP